jgi:hypothetical protein
MSLQAHISRIVEQRNNATGRVMESYAPRIQAWMRGYARWTDRTGNARRTLQATAALPQRGGGRESHSEWQLLLWYQVPYGKWLESHRGAAYGHRAGMSEAALMERGNAGLLAVLWPAMDTWFPRIQRDVRDTRARIGGREL